MPRPSGDDALVMDMTATVLSSREKRRLAEKIQRFEASVDLQLLIASSAEDGHTRDYTPRDIATSLLNSWNMGSQPRNPSLVRNPMGGMLVLLVMDQNRIEIVFSKNLSHLFDEDWVHDLLYTLVVPCFRNDQYGDGLARIVDATQHRLDQFHEAMRQGKSADLAGLSTGLHRQHGWTRGALPIVFGFGGGWILHDIFNENYHNNHGGDETPLLPPSAPPPSPARHKFQGGTGGPFVSPHPTPAVGDNAHPSNSYFWNDLIHLLGRISGSSHNGPPKSGGNSVHIHVGTSSSTPCTRIEESSSSGKLASTTKVNSEAILNSQNSPQPPPPPPPPPPTMQKVDQRKVEAQLNTSNRESMTMNTDKQSIIHQPTFLRSDQKQSFGIVPPKNPTPQKSQIQTTQKNTSSGGGASWFSSSSKRGSSKSKKRTSLLSPSSRCSSGNGGGASWSSSSRSSTRGSTSSSSSAKSSSNRNRKSSSSNGGGASW